MNSQTEHPVFFPAEPVEAVKEQESGQPQREAESEAADADAGFEDEDEDDGIIEVGIIFWVTM